MGLNIITQSLELIFLTELNTLSQSSGSNVTVHLLQFGVLVNQVQFSLVGIEQKVPVLLNDELGFIKFNIVAVKVEIFSRLLSIDGFQVFYRIFNILDTLIEGGLDSIQVGLEHCFQRGDVGGLSDVSVSSQTIFDIGVLFVLEGKLHMVILQN